jgi:hypothetical protein
VGDLMSEAYKPLYYRDGTRNNPDVANESCEREVVSCWFSSSKSSVDVRDKTWHDKKQNPPTQ